VLGGSLPFDWWQISMLPIHGELWRDDGPARWAPDSVLLVRVDPWRDEVPSLPIRTWFQGCRFL
jgi:hypothetical protein